MEFVEMELNHILECLDDLKFEYLEDSKTTAILEPIELEYFDVLGMMKEHYIEMDTLTEKSREIAELKMKWTGKSILKDIYMTYTVLMSYSK